MTAREVQTFNSVFDALADTPAEAANMNVRSELLLALKARIRSWELSQEAAARRLGITRPRLARRADEPRHRLRPDRARSGRRGCLIFSRLNFSG